MWNVWRLLTNTLCSPLLSPQHSAASCYAAAGPTCDCTILVKARVCSSPKRSWTTLVTSICGGHSNGLFIRSCRDSAPRRIRPFSEFRVNLCAVPSCNTVLYKRSHQPMQVFISPMNIATGFSWHRFCLFCAILETYSLQRSFHCSPTLETAAHCEIYLPAISLQTEPFLLQTRDGYHYPKFPAEALEWAGQTRRKAWWGVHWEGKHPGFQWSKTKNLPVIYL